MPPPALGGQGMSIDYVKCFDLIPQAVVLALALVLGMDPGMCCALRCWPWRWC